ncbi:MAG: phosphodiester glycosidase family protein [Synergistaceae bacterium]|nr:phosphodiester glycosidase family protein [Synergistaceae bacterium]
MSKIFRRLIITSVLIILTAFTQSESSAVTRFEFLTGILTVRGIDWSESPEAPYNDAAGFLLRTGYVSDTVTKLDAPVTRREALRWCIECLGMTFEAGLFTDYPTGLNDEKTLTPFERGCLVIAMNMNPSIFPQSDFSDGKFSGDTKLNVDESRKILQRLAGASMNFTLDMIRNPVTGLRVHIHREGVPTGIPEWRFFADGIKTRAAAEYFKASLREEGVEVSITGVNETYSVRSQKLNDYNVVRRLETIAKARGLISRVIPSMTNPNTQILPRFWIMLEIDPSYFRIAPVASYLGPTELTTLSSIYGQNNVQAAINAGFFGIVKGGKGFPIGALRVNGRNFSLPYDMRGCLAWNDDDEAVFAVANATEEADYWPDMTNIIQAGPLVIDDGQTAGYGEDFSNGLISTRHPRSAVGLNAGGSWVFMAVDGRNGMHSSGATISELTEIMRGHGLIYALNLDGGGSTEIIIDGKIYNIPSDGYERRISYALGAVPR